MSARLHAEVVEVKRATERELQKLDAAMHMAAKRTDVTERFAGVDESMISASARTDRLSAQLSALEGTVAEVQANLRLRATASELSQLRGAVEGILSSGDKGGVASTEMVAELARDMASREQAWERRHRAVELSATSSMREVRQMAANIDELGGRLGSFALQEEVNSFKGTLGVLSTLADKDTMRALESTIKEAASSHSVEDLRSQVLRQSAEVGELMATLQERIATKADGEMTRRLEHEVKTLTKAVDEKLGSGVAGKLFEQKADEAALRKLYTQARRDTELIETLRTRMVATEEALASSRRETSESIEQVRSDAVLLKQLQEAADKHWQITRAGREEQGQLVKAVRALLLDAELRVSGDQATTQAAPLSLTDSTSVLGEYGAHGWTTSAARNFAGNANAPPRSPGGGGGRGGGMKDVGSGGGSSSARCPQISTASPSRTSNLDGSDVLSRRRRILAGVSLGGNEGGLTVQDAQTPRGAVGGGTVPLSGTSTRVAPPPPASRMRVAATTEPYPSLASAGCLVPTPINH